jgi:hypothetical protein
MDKAFVLINCEPGKEPLVLDQLHKIKNVVEIQGTYGVYDLVARIESDNQSQLDNIISDQIRKLYNVNSTLTLIPTDHDEMPYLMPDIIPDVIPDQKKPLDDHFGDDDDTEDVNEEDEEYDDKTKLN